MYCGRARWLYSVSDEVGSGMAMRTDMESPVYDRGGEGARLGGV
jgi:hypothetical protein